ncbi:YncE family protein [uncultured Bacteroides sp.]|uniref:YncE family protein n=1 Tax=uncultured Bacteroides sp. TaxID=162156 RepID=UPI0025EEB367|nr:YncE family protein [uncultured Bacteroides sp.]
MRKIKPIQWACLLMGCVLPLFYASCDDMEDKPVTSTVEGQITETGTAEIYILSEGLFNLNNSSLTRYSFRTHQLKTNYFSNINKRGLGDTANDIALYGNKLYIVVNVSSTLEVVDFTTGQSIKQIPMRTENGSSRQPRHIAFHKDKAYVCSFDGTVARIDTTSLEIEATVKAGRNPESLCVQNEKLYVSNSGGLDYSEGIGVDNTVSVIDLASFTEIKKITVGPNPGCILPDSENFVYVATHGKNIVEGDYHLVKINSHTDEVERVFDEKVMNFAIQGNVGYLYNYNYQTEDASIKMFNLQTGETIREHFITDGTQIHTPYGIHINPYSGNIYITEAYSYTVTGDVLCFNQNGQLQFRLNRIGLNPNTVVFSNRASSTDTEEEEEEEQPSPDAPSAYANKVLAYCPAPGQFMNTSTTAYEKGFSAEDVRRKAEEKLKDPYLCLLSLGGFGGSIVVGFDHTVPNISGAYDFKIYGNASYDSFGTLTGALGGSSEPGIVLVSKDVNGNGLADDEWYELKGSEYDSKHTIKDYAITYHRPASPLSSVKWTDNQGNTGYVYRNETHTKNDYYPAWIEEDEMTFYGSRLKDNAVNEPRPGMPEHWVGYCYAYGYADNHPNDEKGALFKIDWAVDKEGRSVKLDGIDFVKIYTAVNQYCGWMGEISTEVQAVEDLHFAKKEINAKANHK